MKKGIKLCSVIIAFIALVVSVIALYTVVFAASDEATLTVTPEGGETTTYNGTYEAMATKVETLLKTLPTVKTDYVIKLNRDAAATSNGGFSGNEYTFVTVALNGFTLDVSAMNNNLFTLSGSVNFTLDGANAKGENGKIINHGHSGGIIYTQNKSENAGVVATVMNVDYTATNMSQGYSTGQYKDQPMCHVNYGRVNLKNVKMTFTGEKAYAVEGSVGGGDITNMTMRFIQLGSAGVMSIEGCEFINTDTKGINVVGINATGNAYINVRDSVIVAKTAATVTTSKAVSFDNCDLTGEVTVFDGAGTAYLTDCAIRPVSGKVSANAEASILLRSSGNGSSVIYSDKELSGTYSADTGFKIIQTATGVHSVVPDGSVEATLSIVPMGGAPTYYSGTYQEMHNKLGSIAPTVKTEYTLTLHSNASYSTFKGFSGNSNCYITVDLNGYTLDATALGNNLYFLLGKADNEGMHLIIDGADATGKRGLVHNDGPAGGIVYVQNKTANNGTTVTVKNLEMYYTHMAQGYYKVDDPNVKEYKNQPMCNFNRGDLILQNVKMTYTGENATAVEGCEAGTTNISDMTTAFLSIGDGTSSVTVEDCEFIDTNTKGIKTRVIASTNTPVTVKNSKLSAFYASVVASGTVEYRNCNITGTYALFNGNGTVKVIDSVMNVPGSGKLTHYSGPVHLLYGDGSNTINSNIAYTGDHIVQTGYSFEQSSTGVYTMKEDTSVEATLSVNPFGNAPTYTTGTFDEMIAAMKGQAPSVATEYRITLNKNGSYTTGNEKTFNSNVTLYIDLNGYDLSVPYKNNLFQFLGNYKLDIDGSDKSGNVGKLTSTGTAGSIVYPRNTGGLNDYTVIDIHDIDLIYTNLSQGFSTVSQYPNQSMGNIPAGTVNYDNVNVTYTGEDATAVEGSSNGADITKMTTPFFIISGNANVTIKNSSFTDTNTKGIRTRGISASGNASVTVISSTITAYTPFNMSNSNETTVTDCVITGNGVVFNGSAPVKMTDTVINSNGSFTSSGANVLLRYGTGKTVINTTGGSQLEGSYTVEEGYYVCPAAGGKFIISDGEGYSTVTLPKIFANGMVFQRGKTLNVYGYCATDGATVKVTLDGKTVNATVENGRWVAAFEPMTAKKDLTLTVEQQNVSYAVVHTFNDVAIGEVWLVNGQSNAEYEVYKMEDAEEYILNADNYDNIRVYDVNNKYTGIELPLGSGGNWRQVTSELLRKDSEINGEVSALAYVMATRLATELDSDVTIAILDINLGGSGIQTWIDGEIYEEYFADGSLSDSNVEAYKAYKRFYTENGRLPSSTSELAEYREKPYTWLPATCYNAMMASLEGYGVKGVIWMQGENDIARYTTYGKYYEALLDTYRTAFGDETLPCFVVQLHPYGSGTAMDFRAAQYDMVQSDPYSYLITAANEGTVFGSSDFDYNTGTSTIHTCRKSPVGHRIADSVLYNVYGKTEYKDSVTPEVVKVESADGSITVTFDTNIRTELGNAEVEGFEIAGEDGVFVTATAVISGKTVILSAEGVTEPVTVRYGYGKYLIEYTDGTLIPFDTSKNNIFGDDSVTVIGPNGEEYIFERDTELIIRSKYFGNITNASGHPLPIFKLNVGYSKES